jgi:hypothetical protein
VSDADGERMPLQGIASTAAERAMLLLQSCFPGATWKSIRTKLKIVLSLVQVGIEHPRAPPARGGTRVLTSYTKAA